jgi:S-(hydroxymethyl)glutathione dehydrogenase / alcohol dehydrogenase
MIDRSFRAAVLSAHGEPLRIEEVRLIRLKDTDVLVRIEAAGLCHTDLEVIEGQLKSPLPIVLGHEAAGVVEAAGDAVRGVNPGDHVILSWNPHCGHCFYCNRDLPILCETYLREGARAKHFDGEARLQHNGRDLHQLMFLGAFAEFCVVPAHCAIPVSKRIPFEAACLIGCGVMTGAGAALNVAQIRFGDTVMVIGCGAVGLSAIQGARLAGAAQIIAADILPEKLALALELGATHTVDVGTGDAANTAKEITAGRGADVVIESAGSGPGFRLSAEAVRPGGEIVWLGKTDVNADVSFRWGSLMQEKRIRRSSYGGARPARDFPLLAEAYLDGKLRLGPMITQKIGLDQINDGFAALKAGKAIRSVVTF